MIELKVGGRVWPWRWHRWQFRRQAKRELGRVLEEWPWTAHRARAPGVTVRKVQADFEEPDYVLFVDLHGWALIDLNNVTTKMRIASALRAFTGLTYIEAEDYEHHARVI